jgi:hypothetical protein
VYISLELDEEMDDHIEWVNRFCRRMNVMAAQRRDVFVGVMRTGDAEAGALLAQRLPAISDVVSVLTERYVFVNTDRSDQRSDGELARFFDEALRAEDAQADSETPVQIFLAPLDPLRLTKIRIRDVSLNDARLQQLRTTRFTWPSEEHAAARVAEEIAAAVDLIVGELDE